MSGTTGTKAHLCACPPLKQRLDGGMRSRLGEPSVFHPGAHICFVLHDRLKYKFRLRKCLDCLATSVARGDVIA